MFEAKENWYDLTDLISMTFTIYVTYWVIVMIILIHFLTHVLSISLVLLYSLLTYHLSHFSY